MDKLSGLFETFLINIIMHAVLNKKRKENNDKIWNLTSENALNLIRLRISLRSSWKAPKAEMKHGNTKSGSKKSKCTWVNFISSRLVMVADFLRKFLEDTVSSDSLGHCFRDEFRWDSELRLEAVANAFYWIERRESLLKLFTSFSSQVYAILSLPKFDQARMKEP